MRAFVVLRLVFSIPSQEVGKRLRNDQFCVEWDVKPQLSVNYFHLHMLIDWVHWSVILVFNSQFSGWLGSRVVSVLDSVVEGPGFRSQS